MLDMRRGNPRAIAPPHQHAILGLAQIRNAHGEPDSDGRQRDGKGEGRNVRQHATAKIVRFIPIPLVARQIIRLWSGILLGSPVARISPPWGRVSQGTWPEFEHPMLIVRRNGPLGFHCCQLRESWYYLARSRGVFTDNVDMARLR